VNDAPHGDGEDDFENAHEVSFTGIGTTQAAAVLRTRQRYTQRGHKLRLSKAGKAQFVTVGII
jgi:hypothetical protein